MHHGEGKKLSQIFEGMIKVVLNFRLLILILIITGFWMVQHQMYATMPKYVLRLAGEGASPSWYANVNPLVVFLTVGIVTHFMRKKSALFSMSVGMFIMPVSALFMASGNLFHGNVSGNASGCFYDGGGYCISGFCRNLYISTLS